MRARIVLFVRLAVMSSAAAAVDEPPRRKSGLWRIDRTIRGMPSPAGAIEVCVDETSASGDRQTSSP
jgi:hypothetical protein